MGFVSTIAVIVFCAALNRFCGVKLVPGKPLLWAAPVFGVVAWAVLGSQPAWPMWEWLPSWLATAGYFVSAYRLPLALAFAFWFWRVWEWGRWIDLGTMPADFNRVGKKPTALERAIGAISGNSDYIALCWRHALVVPGLVIAWQCGATWWIATASPLVALAFLCCYAGAKWLLPRQDSIWLAELGCGAVCGLVVLLSSP